MKITSSKQDISFTITVTHQELSDLKTICFHEITVPKSFTQSKEDINRISYLLREFGIGLRYL